MPIAIDALPYVLSNSALTLLDQQSHEGNRAAAAKTALSRRSGQPGALDAKTADYWSGPLATLYSDLKSNTLIPDRPTLPALPFRNRYRACFPVEHLSELDSPSPSKEVQSRARAPVPDTPSQEAQHSPRHPRG